MMEKEISETYSFRSVDFDEKGRRIVDGQSFRDVVKEYERDFHSRHSTICDTRDRYSVTHLRIRQLNKEYNRYK